MKPILIQGDVDCAGFRRWVYPYLSEELAAPDQERMDQHRGDCDRCRRYAEVERSFGLALGRRLGEVEVPAGLEERIREGLSREAPTVGGGWSRWLRSPAVAAQAAAVLLVALLVGTVVGPELGPPAVAMRVTRAVTVVDVDCDRAHRVPEYQRACRDARHVNALKVGEGVYWNVNLDGPRARELVLDPAQRGRQLVVEADYYPDLGTVRLIRVREDGQTL